MDKAADLARRALLAMVPPDKRLEAEVCIAWPEAVGADISAHSRPVRLAEGTLVVAAGNAAWASQLGYLAEDIRMRLNAAVGQEAVKRVRAVVRPDPDDGGGR